MQPVISSEKCDKKALIALPDAPSLQALLKEEAVRVGYEVSMFNSNERIWSFFEKETPSLVVLGSGDLKEIDLCRKIRAHTAGRHTTILVVSTLEQTRDKMIQKTVSIGLRLYSPSESKNNLSARADQYDRFVFIFLPSVL